MLRRVLCRQVAAVAVQRTPLPTNFSPSPSAFVCSRRFATATAPYTATRPVQPAATSPSHLSPTPASSASTPSSSIPDLSYISESMGVLYPLFTPTRQTLSPFLLTPDQLSFYTTHGYLSNLPCLTATQCDAILSDYKQFLQWEQTDAAEDGGSSSERRHPGLELFHEFHTNQTGDPNNVLCHGLGQWRVSPLFHDLIFHPALVVRVAQCLAACFTAIPNSPVQPVVTSTDAAVVPVSFWHDQLFAKPPKHGGNVAWHQDYSYWTRTGPCNHITVHVALDEQTLENGSLHFIPGSHKWTRTTHNPLTQQHETLPLPITDINFTNMDSIHTVLTPTERQQFKPVPALLKRGEMSIHHPYSVHGSYPNRSERARRATVVNYFVTGTQSRTEEALLAGVEAIGYGKELQSRFFPHVFKPQWLA